MIWARFKLNESNAAYDAIHRSILAGLLGHVAAREERNSYKAAGNRLVAHLPRLRAVRARRAARTSRPTKASDRRPSPSHEPAAVDRGR